MKIRLLLILVLVVCLAGCASTSTTRCEKAQKVLDVASAEVAKYKAAGVMSGEDYNKAILAESAARTAMILVCP